MLYEYKCPSCHTSVTVNRPVANYDDPLECPECMKPMKRRITGGLGFTPVMGGADMPGYKCPVTDQWVDSKKKRREIMAKHDLVERGDSTSVHS